MASQSPIDLAEELVQVVKNIYGCNGSGASQKKNIYEAKLRVQQLSYKIMRDVLGPHEYTVLLAGT